MNAQAAHTPEAGPGADNGLTLLNIFSVLAVLAMAAMAYAVWRYGPAGLVPVHVNLAGQVDRWGSRNEMAIGIGLITLIGAGVAAFCAWLEQDPKMSAKIGRTGRFTFRFGRAIGLLGPGFAAVLMTAMVFGRFTHGPNAAAGVLRWAAIGVSGLMLVLGAFVGRARPNPLIGVRTYWTLTSRLAWDKANRLAGRLLFVIGLIGVLACPFAPMPAGMIAVTSAVILAGLASIIESWRVWRTDPERTGRA